MRKGIRLAAVAAAVLGAAGAARADTLKAPTEEYPTIQSAINAAGEGDTVLVLPGDHPEVLVVDGKSFLWIKGKGNPIVDGLDVQGGEGGRITGIWIQDGPCRFEGTTDMDISKVNVLGAPGFAIESVDNIGLRVEKVHISGAGSDGIHDEGSVDLTIEKCLIEDCDGDGIDLSSDNAPEDGSDGAVVSKNRIFQCEFGVNAGGDGIVIVKNRIAETGVTGIHFGPVTESSGALIEKNRIGNEETPLVEAIQISGQGFNIWSNTVENGGILEDGQGNRLEKNKVTGADTGIDVSGDFTQVYKNTCRGGDTGIVTRGTSNIVDMNKVVSPGGTGIAVVTGNVITYGNRVTNAGTFGCHVLTTGNDFENDRCSGSGIYDLADQYSQGVNSYENCRYGTEIFNFD